MPRLPAVEGRKVVKALRKLGFEAVRQRGSHVLMRHPDGRSSTVPVHAGRILPKGTLRAILDDLGMTMDELSAAL